MRTDATEKRRKSAFWLAHFSLTKVSSGLSPKIFQGPGNKRGRGSVLNLSGIRRFNRFQREDHSMTISTRISLGVSAAVLSLSLAFAPAAFAQDKMGKDDGMKKDSMSKDSMKKDTMSKDSMKKDDGMHKDGMKKDDGMKKN
jgi:pentapeptide MXKDX repeat protein